MSIQGRPRRTKSGPLPLARLWRGRLGASERLPQPPIQSSIIHTFEHPNEACGWNRWSLVLYDSIGVRRRDPVGACPAVQVEARGTHGVDQLARRPRCSC